MFSDLLRTDRERAGLTDEQAARRLGVSPALHRKLEAGERWPDWAACDRIAENVRLAAVIPLVARTREIWARGILPTFSQELRKPGERGATSRTRSPYRRTSEH